MISRQKDDAITERMKQERATMVQITNDPKCERCKKGDTLSLHRVLDDDGRKVLIAWCDRCNDAVHAPGVFAILDPTIADVAWLAEPETDVPQ